MGGIYHQACCCNPYKLTPCFDDTDIGNCGQCSGLAVPKDITLNFYDLATCDTLMYDTDEPPVADGCWYWEGGGAIDDFSVVIPQTAYCIWQKDNVLLPASVLGQTLYKDSDSDCANGNVETEFSVKLQKSNVPVANTLRVMIWAKSGGFQKVFLFHGSTTVDPCDWDNRDLSNDYEDCPAWPNGEPDEGQLSYGGFVNIQLGGGTGRCPGGSPVYISASETSLDAHVGKTILLGGVCYGVSVATGYHAVLPLGSFVGYDDCEDCCVEKFKLVHCDATEPTVYIERSETDFEAAIGKVVYMEENWATGCFLVTLENTNEDTETPTLPPVVFDDCEACDEA